MKQGEPDRSALCRVKQGGTGCEKIDKRGTRWDKVKLKGIGQAPVEKDAYTEGG